jgi:cobalt-zinc-cadmium efflux system membrane fusion protein
MPSENRSMHLNFPKWIAQALSFLPTLAVFVGIGYLAHVGHKSGWSFGEKQEPKQEKRESVDDESMPDEESDKYGPSAFDPTLHISHDEKACKYLNKELKLKDAEMAAKSGIHVAAVLEQKLGQTLSVTGTIEFHPSLIARVSPRAGGAIWKVYKETGDIVGPGEILAIIDAADVGKAKAAFYQAKVQLDLKKQLRERLQAGVSPDRTIIEADAALRDANVMFVTAYQALLNLGLTFKLSDVEKDSDADLARHLQFLGLNPEFTVEMPNETTNNLLPLKSPLKQAGHVLQRDGVQGETVAALQPVFVVGDTSHMMLALDVRQEDARLLAKGQPVEFFLDGDPTRKAAASGKIDWISQEIDPKTRTLKVRAYVPNEGGRLKAKTFGTATIEVQAERSMMTVPEEAVQWEGCNHIVFVRKKADEFAVRKVELGLRRGGDVEVKSGLKPDERIVTVGSHVLKSMLFKDRLGAAE